MTDSNSEAECSLMYSQVRVEAGRVMTEDAMRKGQQSSNEKAEYAPALYTLLATFAVNLLLVLLCCSYTVLGIGTWQDFSVVTRVFSLDKRSIALGRIALGCISLYDLLIFRMKYALCFYTDLGMWPRTLILQDADPQAKKSDFSPYMAVSTYTQILVCFL